MELSLAGLEIGEPEKRTTCGSCHRPARVCWCSSLPSPKIKVGGKILVIQHPAEEKRCLKTVPMLELGLDPQCCSVVKAKKLSLHKLNELGDAVNFPLNSTVLLFPGKDSASLEDIRDDLERPYTVVLLDGTWSQAKSMYHNSPVLQSLKKVTLKVDGFSQYVIRTQPSSACLSSVESGAIALSVLENDPTIKLRLLGPLRTLCNHQLNHGAVLHDDKVTLITEGKFKKRMGRRTERFLRNIGVDTLSASISLEGIVPGSVYSALEDSRYLTDGPLLYRFNDVKYRWISRENWKYSMEFLVPENGLLPKRSMVVFDGVDTASEVYLNGFKIGITDNMFVKYNMDVNPVLKSGWNSLEVRLKSPVAYSRRMYEKQLRSYLVPPACVVPEFSGECHANHIRKMQASFGWDWGPGMPTLGIWKPVRLEAFNTARLRDVLFAATPYADGWLVSLTCHFHTATLGPVSGRISVRFPTLSYFLKEPVVIQPNRVREAKRTFKLFLGSDSNVGRWWPRGYGNQTLYEMVIQTHFSGERERKKLQVGFRTVELVEEPVKNLEGLSFFLRINGVPIFLKGSNWIPADILPERATKDKIQHLLVSAAAANMNVLRVWGGGIYESEYFYELADRLGILVWQDMMFACSMYPTNPEFLETVSQEVRHQIRRLQYHPSVIVWAGNNENEAALRGNWYETSSNFSLYKSDYVKLYVDTIRRTVLVEDQTRPFLVSSPTNGIQSEKEGFVAQNPYSSVYGDVHFYNYLGNAWNWTTYPTPRMASEYGFQSLPSFAAIQNVSLPEDWEYDSEWQRKRQHHPMGSFELTFQVTKRLGVPKNKDKEEMLQNMVYLTQVHQAYSLKVQTEHYRRCRNKTFPDSSGLTMGAMYWQLNDVWVAPSWSSIEYDGKWKLLHFYARKFFAPLVATAFEHEDYLLVDVVSDYMGTWANLSLEVIVMSWDNFEPVKKETRKFDAPGLSAVTVLELKLAESLRDTICKEGWQRRCFVVVSVSDDRGQRVGSPNFYFPESFPNVQNLQKATVEVVDVTERRDDRIKGSCFDIQLSTDYVAPFVYITTGMIRGHLSDNGFLLWRDSTTVRFCGSETVAVEEFTRQLRVVSLSDAVTAVTNDSGS